MFKLMHNRRKIGAIAAAWAIVMLALAPAVAGEWQTYLAEDFSGSQTMFYTGQAGEATYALDDQGRYLIDGLATSSDSLSALTDNLYYYYVEAQCQLLNTNAGELAFTGLIFHYNKNIPGKLSYYVFYVYGDGYYGAKRVIGDQVEILIPLTPTDQMDLYGVNVLAVDAQGTSFDLYLNGRYVDNFTDVHVDGGGFGFYVSKNAQAAFDNFTVKVERRAGGREETLAMPVASSNVADESGGAVEPNTYKFPTIPRDPNRPVYSWEVGVDKTGKGNKAAEAGTDEPAAETDPAVDDATPVNATTTQPAVTGTPPETAPTLPPGEELVELPPVSTPAAGEQTARTAQPKSQPAQSNGTSGEAQILTPVHVPAQTGATAQDNPPADPAPVVEPADDAAANGGTSGGNPVQFPEKTTDDEAADRLVTFTPIEPDPVQPDTPADTPVEDEEDQQWLQDLVEPATQEPVLSLFPAGQEPEPVPEDTEVATADPATAPSEAEADLATSEPDPLPRQPAAGASQSEAADEPQAGGDEQTSADSVDQNAAAETPLADFTEAEVNTDWLEGEDIVPEYVPWPEEEPAETGDPVEPEAAAARAEDPEPEPAAQAGTGDNLALFPANDQAPSAADAVPAQETAADDDDPAATEDELRYTSSLPDLSDLAVGNVPHDEATDLTELDWQPVVPEPESQATPEPTEDATAVAALPEPAEEATEVVARPEPEPRGESREPGPQPRPLELEPNYYRGPNAVLIEDDFSTEHWPVSSGGEGIYRYFGAAYEIDNRQAEMMAVSFQDARLRDCELSIDIEFLDGQSYAGYGIATRLGVENGLVSYYGLFICQSGEFMLLKVKNGQEQVLADWQATNMILTGRPNRIKLDARGDMLIAYINDEQVLAIQDGDVTGGGYGLMAGPGVSVRYDNLTIRGFQQPED
ncbi:hypothetical protein JW859_05190 [bacterium]|nr:hypothetical protein [bacterium]